MFVQRRRRIAKLAHREVVVKRLKNTALKPKPYLTGMSDSRGSRPGFCRK